MAAALSLASTSSHASSSYYSVLLGKYPAASANGCANCHTSAAGGGSRNSYGTAFGNQPGHTSNSGALAAITAIDPLDSDRDSVINSVELTAGSNPGVAGSTSPPPVTAAGNAIAFHDRNSGRYNENCLDCHSYVLTQAPVVANATVTNPRLNQQPRTLAAHGTMLRGNFKPGETGDDRRCQFCHRSVNLMEGPPMPQDALKGAIRKRVDPAVCTLCHGPKTGGQPNSPGPQFYQVGLSQLIPLTDPLAAGQKLYGLYCAGCHDPLANSEVRGESASKIREKINENEGGMGPLRVLTTAQIQAIATALVGSGSSSDEHDD